jgi:hypothetical protein
VRGMLEQEVHRRLGGDAIHAKWAATRFMPSGWRRGSCEVVERRRCRDLAALRVDDA